MFGILGVGVQPIREVKFFTMTMCDRQLAQLDN